MGAAPEELIVLSHGLRGEVEDFTYLLEELGASAPVRAGRAIVHAPRVNSGRTFDGIQAGGTRLAEDIRTFISSQPSLRRISLLGFSLGGLYVRYAAAVLYDPATRTVAGLEPARLILVAAPNLGVRRFGVYRFLPPALCNLAHIVSGETGRELLLADSGRLLLRMTRDDDESSGNSLKFLTALSVFRHRLLYGNTKGDFMVNFGTSALDPDVAEINMTSRGGSTSTELESLVARVEPRAQVDQLDSAHDERGCRILSSTKYEANSGTLTVRTGGENERNPDKDVREMARRLRTLEWTVIAVEFPVNIPVAHNRIVAMSRGAFHTWMNAAGRRVVHHLVDNLLDGIGTGSDKHQRMFRTVTQPRFERPFLSLHNMAPTV